MILFIDDRCSFIVSLGINIAMVAFVTMNLLVRIVDNEQAIHVSLETCITINTRGITSFQHQVCRSMLFIKILRDRFCW